MRVKSVVGTAIMISVFDVVAGDILYSFGDERDSIIAEVERDDGFVRFHYKKRPNGSWSRISESTWMGGGFCFVHDVKRERFEFLESQATVS